MHECVRTTQTYIQINLMLKVNKLLKEIQKTDINLMKRREDFFVVFEIDSVSNVFFVVCFNMK